MTIHASVMTTCVDDMVAAVDDEGALVLLDFADGRSPEELVRGLVEVVWRDGPLCSVRRQLDGYFAGRLREFDLAFNPAGSDFQHVVWERVRAIPYGETSSYGALAASLDRPGAARAIGRANATNPICLVTPCHRVIGADGSLTGFGGGIETKRWLLEHESSQRSLFPGE